MAGIRRLSVVEGICGIVAWISGAVGVVWVRLVKFCDFCGVCVVGACKIIAVGSGIRGVAALICFITAVG